MTNFLAFSSYTVGASAAIAILAGCGSSNGSPPVASPLLPSERSGSWMMSDARNNDLLYVADLDKRAVYVYTYPAGKLEGRLTGFSAPHGECTDKAGNVFIANGGDREIVEYAHGGTSPIGTLPDPGIFANNCAVDPTTGNLAVVGLPLGGGPGNVVIYEHAKGTPVTYSTANVYFPYFDGYDSQGNLYVDGTTNTPNGGIGQVHFQFAELRAGQKKFKAVTLEHDFVLPGAVQWLGKELVVGDQVNLNGPSTIYEFSLKGNLGKQTGSTPLTNSCDVLQFRIDGTRLVAADDCGSTVRYFTFPRGGSSKKVITKGLSEPVGIAISRKP